MIILRVLEVEEYGRITLLLSFFNMAKVFFDLGAKAIFTSEIAQAVGASNPALAKGLVKTYGWFVIITTATATLFFLGVGWFRNDVAFYILAAYTLVFGLNNGFNTLFLSYTRFRRSAGQQVVRSLSRLAVLSLLLWLTVPSAFLFVLLTLPVMELVTLLLSARWSRPILANLRKHEEARVDFWLLFKQQGVYTVLLYPVKQVISELPIWLLNLLVGETAVGIFGVARKAYNLIYAFFSNVEIILTPMLPTQLASDVERLKIAIRQSQKYTFWLAAGVILLVFPLAPFVILLIGGEDYASVTTPLRWMLFVLLLTPFLQSDRPLLFALRQQKWLLLIRLLKLLTFTPLLTYLILRNGAVGAVQAMVIDGAFQLFVRWIIMYRLAPDLWVSPFTIFTIDSFDLKLWQRIKQFQIGELFK